MIDDVADHADTAAKKVRDTAADAKKQAAKPRGTAARKSAD